MIISIKELIRLIKDAIGLDPAVRKLHEPITIYFVTIFRRPITWSTTPEARTPCDSSLTQSVVSSVWRSVSASIALPAKKQRGRPVIHCVLENLIAALLRNAKRCRVLRINQAHRAASGQVAIAPGHYRAHRFGGQAAAVEFRGKGEAELRKTSHLRPDVPFEVRKPDLADECGRNRVFYRPVPEAEHGPVARIRENTSPCLLRRRTRSADKTRHGFVRPHRATCLVILRTMGAQAQTRGTNFRGRVHAHEGIWVMRSLTILRSQRKAMRVANRICAP